MKYYPIKIKTTQVINTLFFLFLAFTIYSCANKGYPQGGPIDETPPEITKEDPPSFTTHFKRKYINIYFNEYVLLKNTDKFIISPPQAKKPKLRLRAKYIMVDFQDSLRENTTYSLDFGESIADNNESNPLGYYRYVFSTGDVIDSLELSGTVVNSETNAPAIGVNVFLYENHHDTVPLKTIPNYMAITDSSGFFKVTNLRDNVYKVVAIKDDSKDYRYTPESERFAFMDSTVRPVVFPLSRIDTLEGDSLVVNQYFAYGPNNLFLRMFEETPTQLYMTSEERKQREMLNFIFSIPAENEFKISVLDTVVEDDWYIKEQSIGKDSISIWMKDSMLYKKDTLRFEISYLRSDSNNVYSPYVDTIKLEFKEKKKPTAAGRKKKEEKEENEEENKIVFLAFKTNISGLQDINSRIVLTFERPVLIDSSTIKGFLLEEKVDTLYKKVDFKWKRDSLNLKLFFIESKWKPEGEYRLSIDSAGIFDIYGLFNDKFEKTFKIKAYEEYGKLVVDLKGAKDQMILQLFPSPGLDKPGTEIKVNKITAEQLVNQNGKITFDYLIPGKYMIRAIWDKNRNGKWDTGKYQQNVQPEQIYYLPTELDIRKNFDVEQEFEIEALE